MPKVTAAIRWMIAAISAPPNSIITVGAQKLSANNTVVPVMTKVITASANTK